MALQTFTAGQTLTAAAMNTLQASDYNYTRKVITTATYTAVLEDRGQLLEFQNAGGTTVTVPLNSSVAYDVGDVLEFINGSAATVSIVGASGVTIEATGDITSMTSEWQRATLVKRETNNWLLVGLTSVSILDSAIVTADISDGAVTTAKIANVAVTTAKITDSAVTTAKIEDDAVTSAKIVAANVTTVKIADSNVTTAKIADSNVTTAKIADANITTVKIADANVTKEKIADSNITTVKIADDNVTTAKIADSNITTAKIADANVTTVKIADANVTTAKIADSNVTTAKIADEAVTSAKIADGTIVNANVSDSAEIAYSKLSLSNSIGKTDLATGAPRAGFRSDGAGTGVTLTSNNYNVVAADLGKLLEIAPSAANATVTITSANDANFTVGDRIDVLQTTSTYNVTIQGSGGVAINAFDNQYKLNGQWAAATLIKRANNSWVLVGNITS